jgi:glycosyltransferase involved in cell wall biosynthesis
MNILFLSQVYPGPHAPVRGTFNRALCRELSREHTVRVIAPRPWTERAAELRRRPPAAETSQSNVAENVQAVYPTFWYLPRFGLHRSGESMLRSVRKSVANIVATCRPDAVLSYWAHPEGECGIELAKQLGVPAACIIGGSDVLLLPKSNPKRRERIERVLRESDALFTVSDGLREACIQLGADPARVHTTYQGVDPATFSIGERSQARRRLGLPESQTLYVWVGRLAGVKRVDRLLDAAGLLHGEGNRFRLYLVGDGPERTRLEQQVANLGLGAVVTFAGPTPPDQLADWYRAADATLLSSESEGLPNVLRESLACGTPFVSTDVGSIREIASASCSLLVASDDTRAFAKAMRDIISPEYRQAAEAHRSRTWRDCAVQMASLLEDCRASRRRSPAASQPWLPQSTFKSTEAEPARLATSTVEPDLLSQMNTLINHTR